MQAMARPCYSALTTHAQQKPAIVFVPSKRHARQTAVDLWAYASADGKGDKFLQVCTAVSASQVPSKKCCLTWSDLLFLCPANGMPARLQWTCWPMLLLMAKETSLCMKAGVLMCAGSARGYRGAGRACEGGQAAGPAEAGRCVHATQCSAQCRSRCIEAGVLTCAGSAGGYRGAGRACEGGQAAGPAEAGHRIPA